ncbi:hypothetical protein KY289_012161 [Solanum tuberosum]|nr:hypothetical protein KY289_012161 [Solanum tuberosum]
MESQLVIGIVLIIIVLVSVIFTACKLLCCLCACLGRGIKTTTMVDAGAVVVEMDNGCCCGDDGGCGG